MARVKSFDQYEVLEKAMQLFWTKGYYDTSVNDLVKHTGLSRSSLYDTYGDKHRLYILALKKYQEDMGSAMKKLVESADSIKDTLNQLFRMAINDSLEDKFNRGCFMVNTSVEVGHRNEEIGNLVRANQDDIEKAFRKAIKKGQKTGEISKKHKSKPLARFLFNTYAGLKVNAKHNPSQKQLEDIVNVAISAID